MTAGSQFWAALRASAVSLALALLVWAVVGGVRGTAPAGDLELWGYDLLINAGGYEPPQPAVVVVDFDEATLEKTRVFPVPRTAVAEVLRKVSSGGPELIGLDILLSERRTPEEDRALAAALEGAGNVVLAVQVAAGGLSQARPLEEFCRPDPASPSFCQSGAFGLGYINMPADDDGFLRRMNLGNLGAVQSFPAMLATNFLGQPLAATGEGAVRFGAREIPLENQELKTVLIRAWSPQPAHFISAYRLLEPGFDSAQFKGKLVLIGQSVAGDYHLTPLFRVRPEEGPRLRMTGAAIHAAAIATLLDGKTVRPLSPDWQGIANLLLAWLSVALVIRQRPAYGVVAAAAMLLAVYALAQFLYSSQGVWMRYVATQACVLLALPAGLGYRFLEERRLKSHAQAERAQLMGIFSRYVSPEVAAEIWERRSEIVLGGQERTATVLFSDIRSFTAITAGKPSTEVLAWLNDYFTAMSAIVQKNGGFLNKFIGDGIMALYGIPLGEGAQADACRAVRTALEMQSELEALNREAARDGQRPRLAIGVGIHTGPLTAGNVGSRDRMEYSVIGETVNLASRLEGLTKDFHTGIVLSPATWALVRDSFQTRELGEAEVRGFEGKVRVYTVEP
ncbi:MAG: CHASE2 domain-containing protein [Terriglobales bacterium]